MAEYIEREAACKGMPDDYYGWRDKQILRSLPAADVRENVKARWLRTDAYPHRIYCSECYATFIRNDEILRLVDIPNNFCANCGAQMGGAEDG